MGMKIHIKRLFNGLLAINVVFVVYLIMHDFDSANSRATKDLKKRIDDLEKEFSHTSISKNTNRAGKARNNTNTKSIKTVQEVNKLNIKNENKDTKSNSKNEKNNFEDNKDDLLYNIELLFPNYMRRNKTKQVSTERDRILQQYNFKIKETKKKIILLYYFDRVTTDKRLKELNCNSNQCHFSRKPSDFEIADAVLFKEIPRKITRPVGKPNQIWIYVQLESPVHTKPLPEEFTFNWTATYRLDSVIPTPYEIFQPYEQRTNTRKDNRYRNYAQGKTKLVAWFVSNCLAKNNRLEYARELQKYIPVDIYGSCGTLKCPSSRGKSCMNMVKRHYKFYLAFENSNCQDYVTEKFFNALRNDVVPVVMGAHPDDYKALAPPQSYIHVSQFKSAEHLAKYLQLLDSNDHLYNSYFQWKGTGDFRDTKFMCRLCSMVDIAPLYPVWYKNVNKWWKEDTCILKNKTWVW